MNKKRCGWVSDDLLYIQYHDEEWGVAVYDDAKLFEFLILETFQAGLSWITVLRKRENFRKAFDHFDVMKVAAFDDAKVSSLMDNAGIIRNGAKIRAAVSNAQAFIQVQKEFGSFKDYIWGFVGGKPIQNELATLNDVPAKTELAERISKDLKKRGFKFVGPTVIYAHMQATGMVNDHTLDCFRHKEVR
ncbi:MAG: DNA-3-methyladenine glycosylase I [Flavobacteriales bacterium]|jgi:DNA-3-methyladenine glycosylase I|nr:DNA-3-methyladenine glycosylase I [Flavobacteriales bacterium]